MPTICGEIVLKITNCFNGFGYMVCNIIENESIEIMRALSGYKQEIECGN